MSDIKYRHPLDPLLTWSGRGKAPKWFDGAISLGFTEDQMLVKPAAVDHEIDLGIGDVAPELVTAVEETAVAVIDAEQAGAVAAQGPAADLATAQQLEVCLHEFGFQALTVEEFIQTGVEELNQATIRACRAGVAFWAAQEALKNDECAERTPEFKDWIQGAGLTKERVYECIRIAKFYARLPDSMRSKALTISKKNALLLASLPKEVIDQAAESGNDLVEKADMMTVAELKEEIKRLERINKNLDADLEIKDSQVKRLSQAKVRTTEFLLRTEDVREECLVLHATAEWQLNALRKLYDDTEAAAPEGLLQIETVWIAANTIAARALDLVRHIRDSGPENLPDRPHGEHSMTPAEAEAWLINYPLVENRLAGEAARRQDKRDAAKPKGPGRPKGSTSKASTEE